MHNGQDLDRARNALHAIPPDLPRDDWVRVGMAAHAAGLSFDEFDAWSAGAECYEARASRDTWRSFKPGGGIGEGTLFKLAADHGMAWSARHQTRPSKGPARPVEAPKPPRPGMGAAEVWNRCRPAPADHAYIVAKQGRSEGLRVVPDADPLRIAGASVAGWLVVPVMPLGGGDPTSLQFIPPPGAGKKLNLPGAQVVGVFVVGDLVPGGVVYVVEGIGQAWACWKATGAAAVVCFGWGRVRAVAAELRQRDASARLVLVPDAGKDDDAKRIAREVRVEVVTMPEGSLPNFDTNDLAQRDGFDALESLLAGAAEAPKPSMPFTVVPVHDLAKDQPPEPSFWWGTYLPAGVVTLLGAHGGTGKSTLGLMLAVALALGRELFGMACRQGKVAYFSGEDSAAVTRHRLEWICRTWGINPAELLGRLHLLDATEGDPTLFTEVAAAGRRYGATTTGYDALKGYLAEHDIEVVIVDNASDAYDASENDRARVRGFMRALARLARDGGAVLLLAHVDKGTSRGDRTGSEGYSGSTAWHNSARSRLYLSRDKDGALMLEHQKSNHGPMREPLRLVWPKGGLPAVDAFATGFVQDLSDEGHMKALLKLIAEFTGRGEFVSTATSGPGNAVLALRDSDGFPPRLRPGDVRELLRKAQRRDWLARVGYVNASRKQRERWEVTPEGRRAAGLAPVAPVAPVVESGATAATGNRSAPVAPVPVHRGCGGKESAHEVVAGGAA